MAEVRLRVVGEDELAMRPVISAADEHVLWDLQGSDDLVCGFCGQVIAGGVAIAGVNSHSDLRQVAFKCPHCPAHGVLPDEAGAP
jgi:hypothetical protein